MTVETRAWADLLMFIVFT